MTFYHALKIARASGYHRLFCYSDSQTMLDLVLKGYKNYHCYAAIIANIHDLLKLDWDISLSHTLREGNACVDFLAKLGLTNDTKLTVWEAPPNDMKELLSSYTLRVAYPRA
ncbi:ribonuclease H protein [Trifolium medium]|uniref:Ribonuclease H protein n=1 Tax=Trifolium medium TaxID=97028 RepID=A0A392PM23_9FABA|nr:ribonuclease H protein [Trifolium medium]